MPATELKKTGPLWISFSGVDGAGKTTQIENLVASFREVGLKVHVVRFWDDVTVLKRLREDLAHALFKGDSGVGTPDRPVRRRDKDVQPWYMAPVRFGLYHLDLIGTRSLQSQIKRRPDIDVLVFDRYLYDQLANLNVQNAFIRLCVRLLLKITPRPDVAYLLDADPRLACARKPEYPPEFVASNRANFLVVGMLAGMAVIQAGSQEEVRRAIQHELRDAVCP